MLPVSDLRRALPRHQPVVFALTPWTAASIAALPKSCNSCSSPKLITPELLPLLAELGFEGDLFLIHSAALLPTALDLCSVYGEGVLLETGLLDSWSGGLLKDARRHVWARVSLTGQPSNLEPRTLNLEQNNIQSSAVQRFNSSTVSAFYFAKSHTRGLQAECTAHTPAEVHAFCADLAERRPFIRQGAEAMPYAHTAGALELWRAAIEELDFRAGNTPWNLQTVSEKVGKWVSGCENENLTHPLTDSPTHVLSATLTGFDAHGRLPADIVAGLPALAGWRVEDILARKDGRTFVTEALRCPALRIEPTLREELQRGLEQCASHVLKAGIKRHHWRRYRELRKVDADQARYHLKLAQSVAAG